MKENHDVMEKIVSLAKRRGFVFQGSEIYGGLAGTWDYGPLGVALKNNIKNLWWRMFVDGRSDMYGMDAAIIMNPRAWEASGHVATFSDPLVECVKCKRRFRKDQVGEKCPECGGSFGEVRNFNMLLKTSVGPVEDSASTTYLRPETAGGMFVNFKNLQDSLHPKMPFGMAQIGKAFRNEIAPRDFLFRAREFEQMEIEYFVHPNDWQKTFEEFRALMIKWTQEIGLDPEHVHELEVSDEDRAFYSKRTIDFEFDYPFGRKELYGLAYRTDYDLSNHSKASSVDLSYYDEETKERYIPHVIEPSFGVDRTVLAILADAYTEDDLGEGGRVFLKFRPAVAPVKVAVFPLLRNKPELVARAQDVFRNLKKVIPCVVFDDNGNIGKRYRRQDEIGTPYCVTIDFDTIEKGEGVTLRNRDTGTQERVPEDDIVSALQEKLA